MRIAAAAFLVLSAATPASPQDKAQEDMRLKKPEMAQYQALNALVDAVAAGKEPAAADFTLKFQPHFVKSATNIYVPYVVEISSGRFSSFPVAVYVRAVDRKSPPTEQKTADYAFTDVFFLADAKALRSTGAGSVELSRGLELPPGEFDLYIAMAEAPPRNRAAGAAKRVVHKQVLAVPDFSSGLTTSSVIVATSLEDAPQQITPQQQIEEPFMMGGYRITPTFTSTLPKSGELLFVFFIYNEREAAGGKPDVDVNYYFYRAAEAKPFSKAATTTFNATSLPAEFNLAAGHQLVVGQGIPLASFAPGDYRLEVRIADKASGQSITRDVPFTVTP